LGAGGPIVGPPAQMALEADRRFTGRVFVGPAIGDKLMAKAPLSNVAPQDNGRAAALEATYPTPTEAGPDPFDPSALHLGADYSDGLGVRKVISTIPVRKPNKSEWFQVRPGPQWRLQTAILEVENGVDRAVYLVAKELWADLAGEIAPALVLTCTNRAGDLFLWRVKLPGPDGRTNTWTESALRIAQAAETTWCRMVADMGNGHYTHFEPAADLPEPTWPDGLDFRQILKIAFRDKFIDNADHAILRALRGAS
jgi:hypothetical protein